MNLFAQAFAWIFDGAHWVNVQNGINIPQRLGETLYASAIAVVVISIIALPLGFAIGHTGRGRLSAVLFSNIARALPTFGLLSLLILLIGVANHAILPTTIVLVILGIPPMLAGAYAGVEAVNKQVVDAARSMGMTEWQIVTKVEWPLAAPLIIGGLRSTALQVISTVIVASYFGQFAFGYYIVQGVSSANYVEMLAGALLTVALVLIVDGLLSIAQRAVAPKGVAPAARSTRPRSTSQRRESVAVLPLQEGN